MKTLGGSPRAIHELVRLLLESDVIVREGVMWRVDAEQHRDDSSCPRRTRSSSPRACA